MKGITKLVTMKALITGTVFVLAFTACDDGSISAGNEKSINPVLIGKWYDTQADAENGTGVRFEFFSNGAVTISEVDLGYIYTGTANTLKIENRSGAYKEAPAVSYSIVGTILTMFNKYDNNFFHGYFYKKLSLPKPNTPARVSAVRSTAYNVQVTWDAVTAATHYNVYCSLNASGPFVFDGLSVNTTFTSTGWDSHEPGFIRVTAVNPEGESPQSAIASFQAWGTSMGSIAPSLQGTWRRNSSSLIFTLTSGTFVYLNKTKTARRSGTRIMLYEDDKYIMDLCHSYVLNGNQLTLIGGVLGGYTYTKQ